MSAKKPKEEMIEVIVMGTKVELPKYQACKKCNDPKGAKWGSSNGIPGYFPQPCYKCRDTKEYEEEMAAKEKDRQGWNNVNHALKSGKPTAMYQYGGHDWFTNYRGDVIKHEKSKPRPVGQKDWKM